MMARFDHLEIGPDAGDGGKPSPQPVHDRDERQWLKQADEARRKGLYENALRYYSRALELDKSLVQGWVGQVQMLVQLDEAPEADLWSRKALEIFPGNGDLLAARAQALCRIGDTKHAAAASDGAMAAQGKSAYRWMARGEWMLACKQKLEDHCFDKARQMERDWLVPLESALIYLHYKFQSRAVTRARQATETAPDQFYAWYVRGLAERGAGMDRPAAESFRHCLQLRPDHEDARSQLAALGPSGASPLRWLRVRLFGR